MKIDIDFDGAVYWNGEAVPDRAALEEKLTAAAAQPVQPEDAPAAGQGREVRGRSPRVMASAQRLGHDQDRHRRQRAVHRE